MKCYLNDKTTIQKINSRINPLTWFTFYLWNIIKYEIHNEYTYLREMFRVVRASIAFLLYLGDFCQVWDSSWILDSVLEFEIKYSENDSFGWTKLIIDLLLRVFNTAKNNLFVKVLDCPKMRLNKDLLQQYQPSANLDIEKPQKKKTLRTYTSYYLIWQSNYLIYRKNSLNDIKTKQMNESNAKEMCCNLRFLK